MNSLLCLTSHLAALGRVNCSSDFEQRQWMARFVLLVMEASDSAQWLDILTLVVPGIAQQGGAEGLVLSLPGSIGQGNCRMMGLREIEALLAAVGDALIMRVLKVAA